MKILLILVSREGVTNMKIDEKQMSHHINSQLQEDIDTITKSLSRPYFRTALKRLAIDNPQNASLICYYILDEQTEINLKESTKEGKIKVLVWLSNFHNGKNFSNMSKQDVLSYLNNLRKPVTEDPSQRWIGSYNGRQAVFLKFFKWLHNKNEPDYRKRALPECMLGIKKFRVLKFKKLTFEQNTHFMLTAVITTVDA